MAGYVAAKRAIFDRQTADDLAVVGVDDAAVARRWRRDCVRRAPCRHGLRRVGAADVWCDREHAARRGRARSADWRRRPSLPGAHNAQNAAAGVGDGDALRRAARRRSREGSASFPGLPHRQQRVATIDGVTFINDSKATNADAAARALGCYDRLIWIAGGIAKAGGIEPLAPFFPRIAHALLIGRDAPALAATLAAHGVPHEIAGTLDARGAAAFAAARATGSAGRAAVAGLRQLRPVHRLRGARRPIRRPGARARARGRPA